MKRGVRKRERSGSECRKRSVYFSRKGGKKNYSSLALAEPPSFSLGGLCV